MGVTQQDTLKRIFQELREKPTDQLFVLKSEADPCADVILLDCRGLNNKDVKPFIEAALSYRQAEGTEALAWQANLIAGGGVGISLLLGIVGIVVGLRKRNT